MQVNRLFEMLYILLEKKAVTAAELAERFEVSTKTIYRDLETLSAAGVPVYAARGRGGGIRILPGFVLDKTVLSPGERLGILSALQGLSASGADDAGEVLQKMELLLGRQDDAPWISIDFSGWSGRSELYSQLKTAILEKREVSFDYYSSYGQKTTRTVHPVQLAFKGRTWYLHAFCTDKEDVRLFKLLRIHNLRETGESFDKVLPVPPDENMGYPASQPVEITLRVAPECAYRVWDEFDPAQVESQPDGSYLVTAEYHYDAWVVGFILSFGGCAEVLAPEEVRRDIATHAKKIYKNHKEP